MAGAEQEERDYKGMKSAGHGKIDHVESCRPM